MLQRYRDERASVRSPTPWGIYQSAGDQAEPEERERGDPEDDGGLTLAGAKVCGHRLEERAEAVHGAERDCRGQEGGSNDEPGAGGVELGVHCPNVHPGLPGHHIWPA